MKIKNTIILSMLTLFLFATSACTKYLDLEPKGQANGEQIWGTANGNRQLLSGAYSRLRKILLTDRPFYLASDLPSNTVFVHKDWVANYATTGDFNGAYFFDWWVDWKPYYQVVTTANTLLNHIDAVPASDFNTNEEQGLAEREKIKAEAHFLYAYTYFWLTRIYGDVPIVKESIESVSQALEDGATIGKGQSSQKDVLEYCMKHIDAAVVKMKYTSMGDDTYAVRADKASALMLKADISIWLANCYGETSAEYKTLLESADNCLSTLLSESGRELVDYSDKDEVDGMFSGQSSEGIFELNVSVDENETYWMCYDWNIHSQTYWSSTFTNGSLHGNGQLMVADASLSTQLYPATDLRRKLFYDNFGNSNSDSEFPPMLRKYSIGYQADPNNEGAFFADANVLLMRLSGAYLMEAEVLYKLGRYGNAKQMLNVIRKRSNIGNFSGTDDELFGAIFDEHARELAGEGSIEFVRIRCNYWDGCNWYSAARMAKQGMYWPVHTSLMSSNRDLVQVPYWRGKV